MSSRLSSRNAQPLALLGREVDLHRQVEHLDHVAEQQARAFGRRIAAHAFAEPQLADVDVEQILRFGIDREGAGLSAEDTAAPAQANASERAPAPTVRVPRIAVPLAPSPVLAQDGAGRGERDQPGRGVFDIFDRHRPRRLRREARVDRDGDRRLSISV